MKFKKFAAAVLAAAVLAATPATVTLFSPFSVTANAADALTEGDYEYSVNEDGESVTITKYTGSDAVVDIPRTLGGKTVTSIGWQAFYYCESLTSVTIPNSVTTIGGESFLMCTLLTSITIPDSVTTIDYSAFYHCESLTSVTIPNSVTKIGNQAFDICTSLTTIDVDIENSKYSSEDGVLFNKSKTTLIQYPISNERVSYTIPNSVTMIGDWAFHGCTSLTTVSIPSGVTTIGYCTFLSCLSLTTVSIPDSVTTIGSCAFENCQSLTTVSIPNSVKVISELAFEYCASLETAYYDGTMADWEAIEIGIQNECLTNAEIICTDGIINERDTETSEPTSSDTSEPTTSDTSEPTTSDTSEPTSSGTSTPTDTSDIDEDGVNIGAGVTAILDEKTLKEFGEYFNISASRVVVAAGEIDKDGNLLVSADANVVKDLSIDLKKEIAKTKLSDFRIINIDLADGDYVESAAPAAIKYTVNVPFDAKVYHVNGDSVEKLKSTSRKKTDGSYDVSFSTDRYSPFIFTTADLKNEKPTDKDNDSVDDGSSAADDTGEPTSSDTSTPTTSELPAQDIPTPDSSDFHKENEVTGEVETSPDAAGVPADDRITSITINPAFNMKNKDGDNVELDLSKITIKASEIYDKEGLKRAEEALGETLNGNKKYNLLDLTLLYNGEDFSNGYEGLVKVIIPLPKGHRDKTFSCYRLVEVNGKTVKQLIPGEQTADSYVIYLEHFSLYALVADGDTPGSGNGSTGSSTKPSSTKSSSANSNSTKNPSTGIALAIAPVVLAAGAVAVVALKKKH